MTPDAAVLLPLVEPYLERQGWYEIAISGSEDQELVVSSFDSLLEGPPGLGRLIFHRGDQTFQILVGWRSPSELSGALRRRESALMGSIGSGMDQLVIYDALADDALCVKLLEMATDGQQTATRVRSVSSLTSHAAIVFDDLLFMKCYRVVEDGERNEVQTTVKLDDIGFNAIASPVGRLRAHDYDLVFVREFLPGALEGRALALTSLRDLLAHSESDDVAPPGTRTIGSRVDRRDPDQAAAAAGGDLASETFRLGQTIAHLHLALREAFGERPVTVDALMADLEDMRDSGTVPGEYEGRDREGRDQSVSELIDNVRHFQSSDLGQGIRLHGELHLRRIMRSEPGWLVTGFSDDPLYRDPGSGHSMEPRAGSPIEDLADMYFSIEMVAKEALSQRALPKSPDALALSKAWARRNQASFLRGYLATPGANILLPAERLMFDSMLGGYRVRRQHRYDATFSVVS